MSKQFRIILLVIFALSLITPLIFSAINLQKNKENTSVTQKITQSTTSKEISYTSEQLANENIIANKKYKVGVLFPFMAAPFWINEAYGILDQAEKVGIEVIWYSADGYTNVSKQNNQIADLLAQNIEGLIIAPTSFSGNSRAIDQVIDSGVPVVIHVTDTNAKGITSRILADDVEIGKKQAQFIINKLGVEGGSLIMLSGPSGADWSSNRALGFKSVIEANENFKIRAERFGEPDKTTTQNLTSDLLVTFPNIDAIYTAADGMAIGTAIVLKNQKKPSKIILTTASFSRESVSYIEEGMIDLNVDESPVVQGRTAINTIVAILNGGTVPERILVPIPEITRENISLYTDKEHWAPREFRP